MSYYLLVLGLFIIVGLLILLYHFLKAPKEPFETFKEEQPLDSRDVPPQVVAPQKMLFKKEIEYKLARCKKFDLSKYKMRSPQELSPQQQKIIYQELKNFVLPSAVGTRLAALLRDPNASAREIAQLIATDPLLSARLLAIVNSAYFRQPEGKKIHSIHQAILLLGFNQVRNLVFHSFIENTLKGKLPLPTEEVKKIWIHSATVASVAGFLAKQINRASGLAVTAGLLHDIGKFFLPLFDMGNEGSISLQEDTENLPPFVEEEIKYGFNHCVIGGFLSQLWKLPEEMTKIILYHHLGLREHLQRLNKEVQEAIILVILADNICHILGAAEEGAYVYTLPPETLQILNLPKQWETFITPELKKEVDKTIYMLNEFYR